MTNHPQPPDRDEETGSGSTPSGPAASADTDPADPSPPGSGIGGFAGPSEPGEPADGGSAKRRRPLWQPALVIAAGLLVVVGVVAAVAGTGDDDDDVIIDREPVGSGAGGAEAATVAVTFGEPSPGTAPADLQLRFVDGAGGEIASRSWSEVEQDAGGSGGTALPGGLLQGVPSGELRLEATLQQPDGTSSCTQQFRTTQGDRLILRLEQGQLGGASLGGMAPDAGGGADAAGDQPCATVQPVAEWMEGRTSPSGEPYVGLSQADAEARARSDGLTTRVVGIDGADFMVTMDLRPDRLDLMIFDGTVVAAQLGAESPTAGVS